MTDAIKAGTILIRQGTPMPDSMQLESQSDSSAWTSVKDLDRNEFAGKIDSAGWTFFFMAGDIKATVFGFNRQKTLSAALKQIIASVKSDRCNSLEITEVTRKSFLKVPYVSVSAHSRHIQKGLVFAA